MPSCAIIDFHSREIVPQRWFVSCPSSHHQLHSNVRFLLAHSLYCSLLADKKFPLVAACSVVLRDLFQLMILAWLLKNISKWMISYSLPSNLEALMNASLNCSEYCRKNNILKAWLLLSMQIREMISHLG